MLALVSTSNYTLLRIYYSSVQEAHCAIFCDAVYFFTPILTTSVGSVGLPVTDVGPVGRSMAINCVNYMSQCAVVCHCPAVCRAIFHGRLFEKQQLVDCRALTRYSAYIEESITRPSRSLSLPGPRCANPIHPWAQYP